MDAPSNHEVVPRKTLQLTAEQERQFAIEPPRMTILSDHPILREDEESSKQERDFFGLSSRLARSTTSFVIRIPALPSPSPYTAIGARARVPPCDGWPRSLPFGKSAKTFKGHKKLRTIWFDPWKFHDREDVWRGLIAEVILNTIDVKGATLATVTNAARQFGLFLGRSFLNVLSNVKLKAGTKHLGGEAEINLDALKKTRKTTSKPPIPSELS